MKRCDSCKGFTHDSWQLCMGCLLNRNTVGNEPKTMTAQELYELMCNRHLANGVYNMITVTWDNLPSDQKQTFEDVAAALSPTTASTPATDIKDMLVGLTQERRQELYKFLHDALNCRMY